MIGYLKGTILDSSPNRVLIDVNGVGYEVNVPLSTYYEVQKAERHLSIGLHIHTHVRDDALALFGFWTERERLLFERLIAVSGIGPKLAQTVLSGMAPDELVTALSNADAPRLNSIPGVGKKTAERMILELRDKVVDLGGEQPVRPSAGEDDLVQALVGLGYKQATARRAVAQASKQHAGAAFADLLKASLKILSRV